MKIDMSTLYATTLILYPGRYIRYIEVNQLKKYIKPTLEKVRKLWESYREAAPITATLVSPSYGRVLKEPKELNTFN